MLQNCGVAVRGPYFEENRILQFHGHLLSRHQPQNVISAQFSNRVLLPTVSAEILALMRNVL
jgi:hypothetical protein